MSGTAATLREAKLIFKQSMQAIAIAGQNKVPIPRSRLTIIHVAPTFLRSGQIDIVKEQCDGVEQLVFRALYQRPSEPMIDKFIGAPWLIAFRRFANANTETKSDASVALETRIAP